MYGPLTVLFYNTVLPLFVRYKIKEQLDSAKNDPLIFQAQMPSGA